MQLFLGHINALKKSYQFGLCELHGGIMELHRFLTPNELDCIVLTLMASKDFDQHESHFLSNIKMFLFLRRGIFTAL